MLPQFFHSGPVLGVMTLLQAATIVRILLRVHRDPSARIAWIAIVAALPLVGILAYFILGEVNIGRHQVDRLAAVLEGMPSFPGSASPDSTKASLRVPEQYQHLFRLGESISGFPAIGGNRGMLLLDSNAAVDSMVADIDAAKELVHLLSYIWLPDHNGLKVVEALKRAATRGVACRALADALGSHTMIHSEHWRAMKASGVRICEALPLGIRSGGRMDLRNHRKMVVVDDLITYCGSQNIADPEFLIKAKYGPWVDAVFRFEGPIARQNQYLFASDWMASSDENLDELLRRPQTPSTKGGFVAQVIGTGPTGRYSAMPEVFESLLFAARRDVIVTTPYYVPDEALQNALCTTAYRGVDTTIVLPARNDSWVVAAASRSYYAELLDAGVKIKEYGGGLLHTKSVTVDGQVTLIGSANMDRRSFDLNYENNVLLYDCELTAIVRERQREYFLGSLEISKDDVAAWPAPRRLWNNLVATLGPVL